ncbi:MAG: transcriptional repressor LexA [Actinomycetota bacterium]
MVEQLTARQRRILEVIREAVESRGYPPSVREIGEAVGLTSPSSVHAQLQSLERKGYIRRDPTKPRAIEVHLSPNAVPVAPRVLPAYVPLVGRIAAGSPILAEEHLESVMPLPREIVGEGTLFMLKVHGDSMIEAGVFDGDFVVVREQATAESGEMVAAMIEDEATIKFLKRKDGHILLTPANPAYEPIPGDEASVLGKVVGLLRRV